jgi:hypothetical protein
MSGFEGDHSYRAIFIKPLISKFKTAHTALYERF